MGNRPVFGAFCCAMLLSSSTWAATIVPGQGDLAINQGSGFQPVNSRVDANVGDSIMVGPGGTATVAYSDGCTVTVQPGAVTTVDPISPCASGSYAQDYRDRDRDFNWGAVALGVIAAGLLGLGIYAAVKSPTNNSTPASP
jgi:hypothetical protein